MIPKYEGLLALAPYIFKKDVQKAFVVGLGGGYTVDLLTSLDIPNVYVSELEQGVLEAANYIYKGKNPILSRPNLHLEVEDARFSMVSKKYGKFDIIISQPSHSWLSGVANLFTKEYFEVVKSNLNQGGIFSQWMNLYNTDSVVLDSILQTFYSVFPHGVILSDVGDAQMIMIGSMKPLEINLDKLEAVLANKKIKNSLEFLNLYKKEDVLGHFWSTREKMLTRPKQKINTDENAYAEVYQSKLFYRNDDTSATDEYLKKNYDVELTAKLFKSDSTDKMKKLIEVLLSQQKYEKLYSLLPEYENMIKNDVKSYIAHAKVLTEVNLYRSATNYLEKAIMLNPSKEVLNDLMATLISSKNKPCKKTDLV